MRRGEGKMCNIDLDALTLIACGADGAEKELAKSSIATLDKLLTKRGGTFIDCHIKSCLMPPLKVRAFVIRLKLFEQAHGDS